MFAEDNKSFDGELLPLVLVPFSVRRLNLAVEFHGEVESGDCCQLQFLVRCERVGAQVIRDDSIEVVERHRDDSPIEVEAIGHFEVPLADLDPPGLGGAA